ncbi:WD40 repeat domain-containing protein [Actinomadura gamaensis]|uniref:WD40 repeat domain-containing protein n=1 Tax=Actinomadura gamaensis TaxID=1763541 RepID=A0ABV9U1G5_9ACTN
MITSARIPTGAAIVDHDVVRHEGETLVVCVEDGGEVFTWSPESLTWTGRPLRYAHAGDPAVAAFPDAGNELGALAAASVGGRLLMAAGGDEQEPALWDLGSGDVVGRTPLNGAYLAGVVAVPGGFVTAEQYSEELRLWSPDGTATVLAEAGPVSCLATARAADRLLVLAGGEGATAWDAATWEELGSFFPDGDHLVAVTACDLAQGAALLGVTETGELYAWPLDGDGDPDEPVYGPVGVAGGAVRSIAVMSVGGRSLLVTPADDTVRLWDPSDGSAAGSLGAHGQEVATVRTAIVGGRPVLVTSGGDGVVRVWDGFGLAGARG